MHLNLYDSFLPDPCWLPVRVAYYSQCDEPQVACTNRALLSPYWMHLG